MRLILLCLLLSGCAVTKPRIVCFGEGEIYCGEAIKTEGAYTIVRTETFDYKIKTSRLHDR